MMEAELTYIRKRLALTDISEPVLEIGAGWDLEFHRRPFRERGVQRFFSHDICAYDGVQPNFLGDICRRTEIPDSFAGCCLLFNVLEHVYAPWDAIEEVRRVLKPGGILIGSVPLRMALHRHDKDYWRFCPDGIAYLMRHMRISHFAIDGNVGFPANILFTCVNEPGDWSDVNQEAVLRPEVILGNDYVTVRPWKKFLLDVMRRRLSMTFEIWHGPWDTRRMRELGYTDWTVVTYPRKRDG